MYYLNENCHICISDFNEIVESVLANLVGFVKKDELVEFDIPFDGGGSVKFSVAQKYDEEDLQQSENESEKQ